jgi:RNA polymerase sigma factor (sigma-70 family)
LEKFCPLLHLAGDNTMKGAAPMEDRQLLKRFVQDHSQEAFAALTARYLSLVYSVCRRELDDADLAEDVTQAVFLILARKAPSLRREVVLSGWLFQTARFAARNARLQETRRKAYEQKAAEARMEQPMETEDAAWTEIEPLLNQSLAALRDGERECVLLRFFQQMSFAETGAAMGLSEEAARKRVTRALEKMRRFFVKNGVVVPGTAFAVLLPTHAVKATPAGLAPAIAQSTLGIAAGHTATAALTGSHVYQLSEGVLKAMKIAQVKMIAGVTALAVIGTAVTYSAVRGAVTMHPTNVAAAITPVTPVSASEMNKQRVAAVTLSQYRTAILKGKVRYENGKPAAGIHVGAQMQTYTEGEFLRTEKEGPPSERLKQLMWNDTWTQADGTYTMAVGADFPYNIMVVPNDITKAGEDDGWVAIADEGVSGHKGRSISVPPLVLTHGGFVTGTITDKLSGKAMEGISIASFGPGSPASSMGPTWSLPSDTKGHYRIRVAPGSNDVYVADVRYNGLPMDEAKTKKLAATVMVVKGQATTANFQVVPIQAGPGAPSDGPVN